MASERDELRIVADQFGCPTATADIAEAILALAPRLVADPGVAGTYHFAGTGSMNWHGFATEIVARQRPFTGRNPRVVAITTAEYPPRRGGSETRFWIAAASRRPSAMPPARG